MEGRGIVRVGRDENEDFDIVGGILDWDGDRGRVTSSVTVVADEYRLGGDRIEVEGRAAQNLEAGFLGKEKSFAAGLDDLTNGSGEVLGEVGNGACHLGFVENVGVAEAAGGGFLLSLGEAVEDDGAKGAWMKHFCFENVNPSSFEE
jgi:hypothetical protein